MKLHLLNVILVTVTLLTKVAVARIIAPASTTLIRAPSLDSAVVQSDRLGGNFAYSTIEGHAYAAITPQFYQQYTATPIEIRYSGQPAYPNVLSQQIARQFGDYTNQPPPTIAVHHDQSQAPPASTIYYRTVDHGDLIFG